MRRFTFIALFALSAWGCDRSATAPSTAANPDNTTVHTTPVNPDNTGVNVRDRNSEEKTPIDQNENKTDVDITAKIRKQVVDTKMSIDAQNVKIITQDGNVTLRGPVKTAEEKQRIEDIAHTVAGKDKVVSQLEIEK